MAGYWINSASSTLNGWAVGSAANTGLSAQSPFDAVDDARALMGTGDFIVLNQTGLDASGNVLDAYSSATDFVISQDSDPDITIPLGATFGVSEEPLIFQLEASGNFTEFQVINFLPQSLVNAADTANPDLATEIQPAVTSLGITNNRGVYYNGTDSSLAASTHTYSVSATTTATDTTTPPSTGGGAGFGFVNLG